MLLYLAIGLAFWIVLGLFIISRAVIEAPLGPEAEWTDIRPVPRRAARWPRPVAARQDVPERRTI